MFVSTESSYNGNNKQWTVLLQLGVNQLLRVGGRPLDVYVTHLYASSGEDSLRLFQVQQLLGWIDSRAGRK